MKMLKQKMLLGMLSVIFLEGCGSNDLEESIDFNQKSIRLVLKIDDSGRRYIDEEESVCFRKRYRYSIKMIGPINEIVEDLDITACNKVIGESPKNYKKKIDWLESIRLEALRWL